MAKRIRWSEEEDRVLLDLYNHNKNDYAKEAAKQLPLRSELGCRARIYNLVKQNKLVLPKVNYEEVKEVLVKNIQNNPGNITKALRKTAEKCNISYNTLLHWYYQNKNNPLNRNNLGVCFTTISKRKCVINGKIIKDNSYYRGTPVSLWVKIKAILKIKK